MKSSSGEHNVDSGCCGPGTSCLFDSVVRMYLNSVSGNLCAMRSWMSVVDASSEIGNARVDGRPRPGKVVTKTLMLREDMMGLLNWC